MIWSMESILIFLPSFSLFFNHVLELYDGYD